MSKFVITGLIMVTLIFMAICLTYGVPAKANSELPLEIGSRLELFVDDYLISSLHRLRLKLHHPQSVGKVLSFREKPWEGGWSGSLVVFKDEDRYRMYYRGNNNEEESKNVQYILKPKEEGIPSPPEVTCYAESPDGINWTKPSLGLFEFNGSRDNNIVWIGHASHNFVPFRDMNPDALPSERFKAIGHARLGSRFDQPALSGFVSADGIRWKKVREEPIITDGEFDSLNVAFWDTVRGHYVAYYRKMRDRVRDIKYATSKDFVHWNSGHFLNYGNTPREHLYTNAAQPYFRAPHIYLAFPMRFLGERTSSGAREKGVSDAVFMSSRDGLHWDRRFMEAFIRPGRDERDWNQRSNLPAPNVVPTATDEISIYVQRHNDSPSYQVQRFVLRTDGFVSVHANFQGGEFVTKPLIFTGKNLYLNFSTSAAGSIQVEVQDLSHNPLPGFSLRESPLIFGDKIEGKVEWGRTADKSHVRLLESLTGRPVRLRFVMKDADLYSIQFR